MNRVVHFEIPADDLNRAAEFYRNVFGWKIDKWEGPGMVYWMVMTAEAESKEPGINGGLIQREGSKGGPGANAFVCTMQVENYDAIEKKILAAGGKKAGDKYAIPGMAWQGYFTDTEGNTIGIHQADANAK